MYSVVAEINSLLGIGLRLLHRLSGGEQDGAQLVTDDDDRLLVLKLQPEPWKAKRLLQAGPVVASAVDRGWPVARWVHTGSLASGAAFVIQEYVDGRPITHLDAEVMQAILAGNALQSGLACDDAVDDSEQLEAVLNGNCRWKATVADHTSAGAELVRHGDELVARAGSTPLPVSDVVHGDYSSTNILLTDDGTVRFIDCETIGRGTRVRDLADLYRQNFVYPGSSAAALQLLRTEACAIAGPQVFAKCAVAVSYNNLAWWVENKTSAEFDDACHRLHQLFDDLGQENATK